MVSTTFILHLGAAVCFGILTVRAATTNQAGFPHGVWLPFGLLLYVLPQLITVWP